MAISTIDSTGMTFPLGASTITAGTVVASTSGTSIDFTALPSWVKRITIILSGMSTSGTSVPLVRLGTGSTTFATTGYLGSGFGCVSGASPAINNYTNGFAIGSDRASTYVNHGTIVIANITGNTWVSNAFGGQSDAGRAWGHGGTIALGAALTAVRLTTVNGTDTFTAGSINILYE